MKHHFADPRPRNAQGEFAGASTGGLDPASMNVAYDPNVIAARKRVLSQKAIAEVGAMGGSENVEFGMGNAKFQKRLRELARKAKHFGSAGMMRQSRVIASLARENSPAHIKATNAAYEKVWQKMNGENGAWFRARGNREKMELTKANRKRIAAYQSRLGLSSSL